MQPRFAFEVALDKAAAKLGIDPIEVRRRNFIGETVETVNGQRITSNGFLECLDAVERASALEGAPRQARRSARGLGVAGSHVHQRHRLPHLPQRHAAERACR